MLDYVQHVLEDAGENPTKLPHTLTQLKVTYSIEEVTFSFATF
jgi:hypothetical protein